MDVLVGQDTNIGEGTTVTQSVIGSACQIGSQVNITNAYIWNNVVIKVNELKLPSFFNRKWFDVFCCCRQDRCQIDVAIIADGAVLNEGVELGRGCIIGPGVILAADTKVPDNTRLMSCPPSIDNDFETSDEESGKLYSVKSVITVYSFLNLPDKASVPLNPKSTAYVYLHEKEEGSDAESLVDELWGLDIQEDSEDESLEDEDIDVDDDDEDFDTGADLPEDLKNARCKTESVVIFIFQIADLMLYGWFCSFLQRSFGQSS